MSRSDWKELLRALDAFKHTLEYDLDQVKKQGSALPGWEEQLETYVASFSDIPERYYDLYLEATKENVHPVEIEPLDPKTGTYPSYIMRDVRLNLGLEENDTSCDKKIMSMPRDEVFQRILEWDGLIHYGGIIQTWIKDIYGIDLSQLPDRGYPAQRSHEPASSLDSKVEEASQRTISYLDKKTNPDLDRM